MAKRRREPGGGEGLDPLYGAPFDEFVAERDALAKRLRGEGERERAAEIRKLRKPSRAAWALNQGVRADPVAAKRLLDSAKRLEAAQEAALAGSNQDDLRKAMASHHEAVEAMIDAVGAATGGGKGSSAAVLDRARETLRAVAGDAELREELAAGRVTRDRRAVGLGGLAATAGRARVAAAPAQRQRPSAAQRRRGEQRAKRAQRELDAATKRVTAARSHLDKARRNLDAAQAEVDEAEAAQREREADRDEARAALAELDRP
jgi:prophage DNA circulation protein